MNQKPPPCSWLVHFPVSRCDHYKPADHKKYIDTAAGNLRPRLIKASILVFDAKFHQVIEDDAQRRDSATNLQALQPSHVSSALKLCSLYALCDLAG
jgi:hypothetical protein